MGVPGPSPARRDSVPPPRRGRKGGRLEPPATGRLDGDRPPPSVHAAEGRVVVTGLACRTCATTELHCRASLTASEAPGRRFGECAALRLIGHVVLPSTLAGVSNSNSRTRARPQKHLVRAEYRSVEVLFKLGSRRPS